MDLLLNKNERMDDLPLNTFRLKFLLRLPGFFAEAAWKAREQMAGKEKNHHESGDCEKV
jgi:hypothetical protein